MKRRNEWVLSHICGDDRVLNVGCVGGRPPFGHLKWLHGLIRKKAGYVVGVDNDKEGIRRLQKHGINVAYADAQEFALNSDKFDVIVAGELIEHLSNPGLFLDCSKENLEPDGKLILTTPNARHLGIAFSDRRSFEHIQLYSPSVLTGLLKRHEFKVIEVQFLYDDKTTFLGKIYENTLLRIFPQLAHNFGIIAILQNGGRS